MNLLISLLPIFAGVQYGGGANGKYQCFLEDTQAGIDWFLYIMVIPGTICAFLGVLVLLLLEFERRKKYNSTDLGNAISSLISKNLGYPICLFVSWGPFNVVFLVFDVIHSSQSRTNPEEWVLLITFLMSSLFGILIGVVFFSKSSEARQRWIRLWKRIFTPINASNSTKDKANIDIGLPANSATGMPGRQKSDITADFIDDDEWDERVSVVSGETHGTDRTSGGINPMRYSDNSEEGSNNRIVSGDIAITNLHLP